MIFFEMFKTLPISIVFLSNRWQKRQVTKVAAQKSPVSKL